MTVALEAPRAISGALTGGDNVTIYATFSDVDLTLLAAGRNSDLGRQIRDVVRQQQQQQQAAAAAAGDNQNIQEVNIPTFDVTVTLTPEVEVLRVLRESRQTVGGTETQDDAGAAIQVILAFEPEEAAKFVFALEQGTVYMSLLPPDQDGIVVDPQTVAQIVLPEGIGGGGGGGGQG
jgi:hypothetical protein